MADRDQRLNPIGISGSRGAQCRWKVRKSENDEPISTEVGTRGALASPTDLATKRLAVDKVANLLVEVSVRLFFFLPRNLCSSQHRRPPSAPRGPASAPGRWQFLLGPRGLKRPLPLGHPSRSLAEGGVNEAARLSHDRLHRDKQVWVSPTEDLAYLHE